MNTTTAVNASLRWHWRCPFIVRQTRVVWNFGEVCGAAESHAKQSPMKEQSQQHHVRHTHCHLRIGSACPKRVNSVEEREQRLRRELLPYFGGLPWFESVGQHRSRPKCLLTVRGVLRRPAQTGTRRCTGRPEYGEYARLRPSSLATAQIRLRMRQFQEFPKRCTVLGLPLVRWQRQR